MIQLSKGNKLKKPPHKYTALENDQNLHYGERCGKNVIGTSEYNRNLQQIKMFNPY